MDKQEILNKIKQVDAVKLQDILRRYNLETSNFYHGCYSLEKTKQVYNEYLQATKDNLRKLKKID